MSIDQRLREGLRATNRALPTPEGDRAFAAVTAGARRMHRRNLVVGLAAAAAVIAAVAGLSVTSGREDPRPVGPPSPTSTPTETTTSASGRIQSTDEYLARTGATCDACEPLSFDQDTGTLLAGLVSDHRIAALRVFGPAGQVAALDCPPAACGVGSEMSLGPATDEISILDVDEASAVVRILGFDGSLRRILDLTPTTRDFYDFQRIAWSADGSRLAVTTTDAKVWLLDPRGADPRLVYDPAVSTSPTKVDVEVVSWQVVWSPDGSRLGFIEGRPTTTDRPSLFKAVSLQLPDPGQSGPGEATTLYDVLATPDSGGEGLSSFLWSPDGERVGIRVPEHVLELSAEDGHILAEHPFVDGLLIWPARQP